MLILLLLLLWLLLLLMMTIYSTAEDFSRLGSGGSFGGGPQARVMVLPAKVFTKIMPAMQPLDAPHPCDGFAR